MRRVILAIVTTAVALVLLLSFKTHTQSAPPGSSPAPLVSGPAPGSPAPGGTAPGSTGSGPTRTVTGKAFPTIYGPVQVKITVTDGRVTAATAVQYPRDTPRDDQINSHAIPLLNQRAVAAGNAKIDAVSGATYTSGGYIGSLQNALDQAGLG
jgi:hypothetical protein